MATNDDDSVYAQDIFSYYKARERFFRSDDYFSRQPHINESKRALIIDWVVELQETFELNHETLYLAVKLFDLYLTRAKQVVHASQLELIASAAFFIASKYDERFAPVIDDLVHMVKEHASKTDKTACVFTREQLLTMERELFRMVDFDLGAPLSYRFLRRYARMTRQTLTTLTLARYVLETSLMFFRFNLLSESLLAAAAYLLAVRMMGLKSDWSPLAQQHSGYQLEQVEPLMHELNMMVIKRKELYPGLCKVFDKYRHEVFLRVANIASLPVQCQSTPRSSPDDNDESLDENTDNRVDIRRTSGRRSGRR